MIDAENQPHVPVDEGREDNGLDQPSPSTPGILGLVGRIGDAATWDDPSKCILIAGIALVATTFFTSIWLYTARNPGFAPYVDQSVLSLLLRFQAVSLLAWTALLLCGLVWRGRGTEAPLLSAVCTLFLSYHLAYVAYFLGAHTNPFSDMIILGCWVGGLMVFPRRLTFLFLGGWWLALIGTTVAQQLGYLPYAPLYGGTPYEDGRLHPSWLTGSGGITLFLLLFTQVMLYFIIERWHDREKRLAITSKHLAQANDVISRYIASQLAEQIRAGNYSALERHERRRLTLFFSDIQDFAATADSVEPEDFSLRLNEYLSEMTGIAERYGATIDKFVGDAIMIFFGAPSATDDRDQALRAVRMAIEMQKHLVTLRQQWAAAGMERPFHVRMGINTGQASVGAFGSTSRLEYTAIGRQVNLASRLEAQCEADRVLLSHATYMLVQDEIPCTPKGEITVKGFHSPVKVYEVDPAGL